jgi:hypothetical protein
MLLSKAIVDGVNGGAGKYSAQQRQRLYRVGIREFFRLDGVAGSRLATLGDCGAFSYVRDERPPYTVDDLIDFYDGLGFDSGLSLDHVVPGFVRTPASADEVPQVWRERHQLTLDLAEEFLLRHEQRRCTFEPVGVAQGWDAPSYAHAVERLQEMGYTRVALGGLVPLKSADILATLEAVAGVRCPHTELHLLGVTRWEHVGAWSRLGVTSFDTTSPLRQAFKDDRDNYHGPKRTWIALRIPQADGNTKLQQRIRAGEIDQAEARRLERRALVALDSFDRGATKIDDALEAVIDYGLFVGDKAHDRTPAYREVLEAAPWKSCRCKICKSIGIHVMLLRGAERNRRRGFHNLQVFARRLQRELKAASSPTTAAA